jgi:hypothetical protein
MTPCQALESLPSQRNKANVHSSANAGVGAALRCSAAVTACPELRAVDARMGPSSGDTTITSYDTSGYCRQLECRKPQTDQAAGDVVGRLELGALATRAESRVENHLETVMSSVQRTTAMTLGVVISVHKSRALGILRPPAFPTNRAYLLLILVSDSKAVSGGLSVLGWLKL